MPCRTPPDRGISLELSRPRILLVGSPAARPDGLERLLIGAGFQLEEAAAPMPGAKVMASVAPDIVIYTQTHGGRVADDVRTLVSAPELSGAPVFAILTEGGADTVVEALRAGAHDALGSPVYLAELQARLAAHARTRNELREAQDALRSRELLFDIFQEVSASLRADEIFQTLVRRVGHAFGLTHCSFVVTGPGETHGRVVAVFENPSIRDLSVELERYPEIVEAIRTERPVVVHDVRDHPLFETIRQKWVQQQLDVNVQAAVALPVFVQGRAAGVFFLRTERGDPQLRPQDVAFANTIAQAAARVLENEERRSAIYRRQAGAGATDELTSVASLDALDRRLRDEFERARRYQLRFSLVLIDVDRLRDINARLGQDAGDRILAELGRLLQREIRAPDFVARYGGDEFALILPETDESHGRQFVERVRRLLARHTFSDLGLGNPPAISAGVVAYPHAEALRAEDLFTLLEGALANGKAQQPDRIGMAVKQP